MAEDQAQELTHDEVWDDSVLVKSWNEAFEEYKKYHSLAASGKKVEESIEFTEQTSAEPTANGTIESSTIPVNFTSAPSVELAQAQLPSKTSAPPRPTRGAFGHSVERPPVPSGLKSVPQNLLGTVENEALKNIMMSWYYAGYYTGLYEGQQQAWTSMQEGAGEEA